MNGLELKERRKNIGLTQEELAEETGMTRKTINSYENGVSIPNAKAKLIDSILTEKEKMFINKSNITISDNGVVNNNLNQKRANTSFGYNIDSLVKQLVEKDKQLAEKDKQINKLLEMLSDKK